MRNIRLSIIAVCAGLSISAHAAALSDDEIAAVIATANNAEITAGTLAKSNAHNAEVKEFAQHMITDHQNMDKAAGALATKLNLNPTPSELSENLKADADKALTRLKSTPKGLTFDQAYIQSQIDAHQKVLDVFSNELIPNAKDANLKNLLQDSRKTIQSHLDHARKMQASGKSVSR